MSAAELVRIAKYKGKFNRDTELAAALNVNKANVSSWLKGSTPNAVDALKLAKIADLNVDETLKILQGGFASVSLLIVTSVFMSLIYMHNFGVFTAVYTLCEIVRVKIMSFAHGLNRMILAPLQDAFYSRIYKPI